MPLAWWSFTKFQVDVSCGRVIWRLDWSWNIKCLTHMTGKLVLTGYWQGVWILRPCELLHRAACVSSQCGEHDRGLSELLQRQGGACSVIHYQERLEPWKSCTSAAFYRPHKASPESCRGGDRRSNTRWGSLGARLTLCSISGSTAVPGFLIPF